MDPFSAATGAFSVVSLAIQFADGINQLCKLLHSITDAPKEVESIINDLNFFIQLLDEIRENENILGPYPPIRHAVERCEAPLDDLHRIADSLVPGFAVTNNTMKRKWTAIGAVRKKDKIIKFQEKLRDAKIDLVLARTLAADRTNRHYSQSYQESLVPVVQGIADIREKLSYHSDIITFGGEEEPGVVEDLSNEIRKAFSSWPLDQFRSTVEAELRKEIQSTIASVLEQHGRQKSPLSGVVEELQPDCDTLLQRYRNRVAFSHCSKTKSTVLGEIHYKNASYLISPKTTKNEKESDSTISTGQLEVETSFSFVPSWWMTKFVTARAVKFDIVKLSTQGWQTNLHSFNVVPEDSPIFEFCRRGNLEGVRYLIGSRKAFVNDMTEYGWTPLHFAASQSQADVCALLLQEGAHQRIRDYTIRNGTPFVYACLPGFIEENGSYMVLSQTATLKQTIREFIKAGEDCADFVSDGALSNLVMCEHQDRNLPDVPSMWLLNNILPITNPTILLDRKLWQEYLVSVIIWKPGHSSLPEILRHCDTSMARSGLLRWISTLGSRWSRSQEDGLTRDFQLLVQISGGLCFVHEDIWGEETSPIFMALRFSRSFFPFRAVLEKIDIDIRELIRNQIEEHSNGWAEERLLSLYLDQTIAERRRPTFDGLTSCKLCKLSLRDPDWEGLEWKRRVERIRVGVALDAPLSDEEERDQKELDDAIEDSKNGICLNCHWKKRQPRKWNPLG